MSTPVTPAELENADVRPPLALIAGPTASGKSDLAVRLAKALGARGKKAAVINADSAQVYADLQILSARPSEAEMEGIDHHLYGTWDGAIPCSAADWADAARRKIAALHAAKIIPILCGGTGLYMRTLLEGIAPIPDINPEIRAEVRALASAEAHKALHVEDPSAAERLAPSDAARNMRALEVVRSTGKPLVEWQKRKTGGIGNAVRLAPLILLPDREWLYERCDRRFAIMVENGAVEEVEALLARNLDPDLPVMRAIGVPEIGEYLAGRLSMSDAIINGQRATRNYAKRQFTWFRRQPPAEWPRIETQGGIEDVNMEPILASLLQS